MVSEILPFSNVMGVRSARVKLLSVEQGTEAVMVTLLYHLNLCFGTLTGWYKITLSDCYMQIARYFMVYFLILSGLT